MTDRIRAAVEAALGEPILAEASISGGCIADTCKVKSAHGDWFVKSGSPPVSRLFEVEQLGLELLRTHAGALRIPEICSRINLQDGSGALVLEWIDSRPADRKSWNRLGAGLARLHRTSAPEFGLGVDNYIGASPQPNAWEQDWPTFFANNRLLVQAEYARDANRWEAAWTEPFDRLCRDMESRLPGRPLPSLVHGDLWSGNVLFDTSGCPVLLDPAVYFADREVDLAMTHLFGSFPQHFYDAYTSDWPLEKGWQERIPVYNLYHLLNHLNLFGGSYASSISAILGT